MCYYNNHGDDKDQHHKSENEYRERRRRQLIIGYINSISNQLEELLQQWLAVLFRSRSGVEAEQYHQQLSQIEHSMFIVWESLCQTANDYPNEFPGEHIHWLLLFIVELRVP